MNRFLIIQTAFLGDAVLATSVIEKLHDVYPGTAISILIREGNEGLFKDHPFLEKIIVWRKKESKIKNLFSVIREVKSLKFDMVINLQRFFSSGLITVLSGANKTIGFNKNPLSFLFTKRVTHTIGDGRHEIERNQDLISNITNDVPAMPRLYPSTADFEAVKSYTIQNYVIMTPASVWFTKQLPVVKWQELIDKIPSDYTVYLLGAPGDKLLCDEIMNGVKNQKVNNLAGRFSLLQTAALMKNAKMNYVNDSGPLHIASAMNAPVTAFFCSTIPAFGFGPLSTNSTILQTDVKLTCRPCGLHGRKSCPEGHFKCALTIMLPEINNL